MLTKVRLGLLGPQTAPPRCDNTGLAFFRSIMTRPEPVRLACPLRAHSSQDRRLLGLDRVRQVAQRLNQVLSMDPQLVHKICMLRSDTSSLRLKNDFHLRVTAPPARRAARLLGCSVRSSPQMLWLLSNGQRNSNGSLFAHCAGRHGWQGHASAQGLLLHALGIGGQRLLAGRAAAPGRLCAVVLRRPLPWPQ